MSTHYQIRYPSPALKPYVKCYLEIFTGEIGQKLNYPLPAQLEQSLFISLEEIPLIHTASTNGSNLLAHNKCCYILGQLSHSLLKLQQSGVMAIFSVAFHPTGFYRLFGIPMNHLTDSILSAEDVLSKELESLSQYIRELNSIDERLVHVEKYLSRQLEEKTIDYRHIDDTVLFMLQQPNISIPQLASISCLSERQFRRKFMERTGVAPHIFSRVSRVHYAWNIKQYFPQKSWRMVAQEAGYTDQSHLIREMKLIMGIEKLSNHEDFYFIPIEGMNFKVGELYND